MTVSNSRVLILGAGGLGTVVAGFLARTGADVTLFMRPGQAAQFDRHEVHIDGATEFAAPIHVVSRPELLGQYDYVLVCVKARDTQAAIGALQTARFDSIVSLQNGIAKNVTLARHLGSERLLGGLTYIAGALARPGYAHATNPAPTFIGELGAATSPRAERLVRLFETAGLPAACVPNILTLEWYKLAIFLRTALVSALTRLDIARLTEDPALRDVCAAVAREVVMVAEAEGHRLPREALPEFSLAGRETDGSPQAAGATHADFVETLDALGEALRRNGRTFYPSLAQDVMAGRPTELEETAGEVLILAGRRGIQTPVLGACTNLLRGLARMRQEAGRAP